MFKDVAVLVTTKYKGTFVGRVKEFWPKEEEIVLTNSKMVIRWGTTDGVSQLANSGVTERTKLAAKSAEAWICGVTHVEVMSESAWESMDCE